MITHPQFNHLKSWFHEYVDSFKTEEQEIQKNFDLKSEHSLRVCSEIKDIGNSLHLDDSDLLLAETIALLHDIGRFEQYRRYGTFLDRDSENHALLGAKILSDSAAVNELNSTDKNILLKAVEYHSLADLPASEEERVLFFTRMIRDADKIDILRIVTDNYDIKKGPRNTVIDLGLPEHDPVSDAVYRDLLAEGLVKISHCKSLNDFKMLQIGWLYDINFSRTFHIIRSRRYIDRIFDSMPVTEKISAIRARINERLRNAPLFRDNVDHDEPGIPPEKP